MVRLSSHSVGTVLHYSQQKFSDTEKQHPFLDGSSVSVSLGFGPLHVDFNFDALLFLIPI